MRTHVPNRPEAALTSGKESRVIEDGAPGPRVMGKGYVRAGLLLRRCPRLYIQQMAAVL